MKHKISNSIIKAYIIELNEVEEAAIRLRNEKRLTPYDLICLALMVEREFKKPIEEWKCTPMQLFNSFIAYR